MLSLWCYFVVVAVLVNPIVLNETFHQCSLVMVFVVILK